MNVRVSGTWTERAEQGFDVVTGAFSYSGAAICANLTRSGRAVRTLTGHPERAGADTEVDIRPLDFTDPQALADSLLGADTLYNTYWVRFARGDLNHASAVSNSTALFRAAADAGIRRIVHISITNPSLDSPYPYFRGKAQVEEALAASGPSFAVLRPAILFGGDGVLVNNIAWLLRRLPVFAIGGGGHYRIRPIHVDDLAQLAIRHSLPGPNLTIDAVGPERPTFKQLVRDIRSAVHSKALLFDLPGPILPPLSGIIGRVLHDELLTRDEYRAMADGLADTTGKATADTSFTTWITDNADSLGRAYAHEIKRHFH